MEQVEKYRKIDFQNQTHNWKVSNLYSMLRHDIPFEPIPFENWRKFNPEKLKKKVNTMENFVYTMKYPDFDGRVLTHEHILHNDELIPIRVLWDTGSTYTCISTELVKRIGLDMSDGGDLGTTYGKTKSNKCHIELILDKDMIIPANVLTHDYIHEEKIDLLLGMDIIMQGDFAISSKNGEICFSFRCPSEGFIDFKEQEIEK